MTTCEIIYEGTPVYRLTSLTETYKKMMELSRENEGDYVLWTTEINPETGQLTSTQIITLNNGVRHKP